MYRKSWAAVLIIVVVVLLFAGAGVAYFFLLRPQTSSVESLGEDFPTNAEQELENSLPLVFVEQDGEAAEVRAFYLDCKQADFDLATFNSRLKTLAPSFSQLRVSLGTQPVFTPGREGQLEEVWTSAPDAVYQIGKQFNLDPRVLATLIELETGGLTNPLKHPLFPLLYPDAAGLKDEFQIQVGIAADAIAKQHVQLKLDENTTDETLTSQAILRYLAGKKYTAARIGEFTNSTAQDGFVSVYKKFFTTDPRVCRR